MYSTVDCLVENVNVYIEETGFTVLEVNAGGDYLTVVGTLGEIVEGERLILYGEYVVHPNYGQQFKAVMAERILPSELTATEKYLGSGIIQGIGPVIAERIVDKFQYETFEVIEKEPEKLSEIKGISLKRAREISQEFVRVHSLRNVINKLSNYGLPMRDVLELFKAFEADAPQIIEDNPYMLCGYPTYCEFNVADGIAKQLGRNNYDEGRLTAGLIYVLRHNHGNGHTCLPVEALIKTTASFLEVEYEELESRLYESSELGLLRLKEVNSTEMVYMPDMYEAESYISEKLYELSLKRYTTVFNVESELKNFENENSIEYSDLQREMIMSSLSCGLVVITGGPGTGKTTGIKAIISMLEMSGEKICICAPTGRAAKRLTQLTGKEASTIHRLLEVDYNDGTDKIKFVHNAKNKLKYTAVIIDEMSMVDVELFYSLCLALKNNVRLILVGDADQLPAVGPGNLLKDIIDSGVVKSIQLNKIFRQAEASQIITNSHAVIDGQVPDLASKDGDFFFLRSSRNKGASYISNLVSTRLPTAYKFDPLEDIQVISPGKKGYLGVIELNEILRAELNPPSLSKKQANIMGRIFRVGDKIMQIRNNYDIECRSGSDVSAGVYNGDIGYITDIDSQSGVIYCRFDDRNCMYTFAETEQLELAYAITVHKSQGSEYPAVVLSLVDVNSKLQYRNLLYTAMTRAKKLLIVVGDEMVFRRMVENNRRTLRYTGLKQMLSEKAIN